MRQAEVNEYPWQARIEKNGVFWCGGSLLNSKWVLSAAHCTIPDSTTGLRVVLGDHSRSDSNEADHLSFIVSTIINHPYYSSVTFNYDYTLLKLSEPVDFMANPHIRPICLPTSTSDMYTGDLATVTGWGRTAFGGQNSDVLMEVEVTVLSNSECSNSYSTLNGAPEITSEMICTADPGKSACHGDSGGPMVTTDGYGVTPGQNYEIIGVVSWGAGCASYGYPAVFARVTSVLSWIQGHISDGEFCPPETPDMFVESSGGAQTHQSAKLGTYTYDDTQVIHGMPVWKSTTNENLLYIDTWGAWRIGPEPNWGGIASNWRAYGSYPDGSVNDGGWWYWNGNSWVFDSTLKITGVPRSSRGMEQQREGHGTSSGDSESGRPVEPPTSQNITKSI